ncbi:5410_t:CDS:1, partial [Funneliformis mosseae]
APDSSPNNINNLPTGPRTGGSPNSTPNGTNDLPNSQQPGEFKANIPSIILPPSEDTPEKNKSLNQRNSTSSDTSIYVDVGENKSSTVSLDSRKSVVYVDEAENIRNSVVYVDEDGNELSPDEAENIRNSVVYVDEDGNELSPDEAEKIRNSVVYVDEEGNKLSPDEAEKIRNSVVYVDEEGNKLSPDEAEKIRNSVVYVDEDGKPIDINTADPEIRKSIMSMTDKPIEVKELNQENYAGEGASKSANKLNLEVEDKNPANFDASPTNNTTFGLGLATRLKKIFKKNK